MSTHEATIAWARSTDDFKYETYGRDHAWTFGSGATMQASAAPEFRGSRTLVNPEEAFVASLASCHMLTFLAVAARRGLTVDRYDDHASGVLEKNAERRLAITRVVLRPRVAFSGKTPDAAELAELHRVSHEQCFIASSVKTEIVVEPS